jgi:hypothetical protein
VAAGFEIEAEGADRLTKTLDEAADDLSDLARANRDAANLIASRARQLARVKTGHMRDSIVAASDRVAGRVSSSLIYTPIQEYGWRAHNITPGRFIRNATEQQMTHVQAAYAANVQAVVDQIKGK